MAHFYEIIFLHHYMDVTIKSDKITDFIKSTVQKKAFLRKFGPKTMN